MISASYQEERVSVSDEISRRKRIHHVHGQSESLLCYSSETKQTISSLSLKKRYIRLDTVLSDDSLKRCARVI